MRGRSAAIAMLVVLTGCLGPRRDTSAFYLLSPTATGGAAAATSSMSIGIGPVSLAGYLDRPQIVVRLSGNQVSLSDSDRWAEPLGENVASTLEENLKTLLPGASFVRYPWFATDAPDYAVALEVRRFEADASGAVVLDATWTLARGATTTGPRDVRITEQAEAPGQEASVAALSRALGELSAQVATAIGAAGAR